MIIGHASYGDCVLSLGRVDRLFALHGIGILAFMNDVGEFGHGKPANRGNYSNNQKSLDQGVSSLPVVPRNISIHKNELPFENMLWFCGGVRADYEKACI